MVNPSKDPTYLCMVTELSQMTQLASVALDTCMGPALKKMNVSSYKHLYITNVSIPARL